LPQVPSTPQVETIAGPSAAQSLEINDTTGITVILQGQTWTIEEMVTYILNDAMSIHDREAFFQNIADSVRERTEIMSIFAYNLLAKLQADKKRAENVKTKGKWEGLTRAENMLSGPPSRVDRQLKEEIGSFRRCEGSLEINGMSGILNRI
jgi:hypothetical protein